jgi:hypothetical protein
MQRRVRRATIGEDRSEPRSTADDLNRIAGIRRRHDSEAQRVELLCAFTNGSRAVVHPKQARRTTPTGWLPGAEGSIEAVNLSPAFRPSQTQSLEERLMYPDLQAFHVTLSLDVT